MTYTVLLGIDIKLRVCVDSKDLMDTLTKCHEPTDKSLKADAQLIRYEFETNKVNWMTLTPGKLNPPEMLPSATLLWLNLFSL